MNLFFNHFEKLSFISTKSFSLLRFVFGVPESFFFYLSILASLSVIRFRWKQ